MSLKVWLPLNGDLENKGISNVNITANGASVNTSGKIGSCYSFDGSDDYISLDGSVFYDIIKGGTQPFSIAMWIYHNDSTRAILFGDYSLSGAIGFNIELTTAHQIRFYWNGSPDKNFDSNSSVGVQTWTHITLTYDGSQLLLYKNGAIISDKYSGALAVKTKSSGAYYLGRDSRTGSTALNGRLNDFRLYDHCLSAAEVKEIAQGLILHYKLDGEFCGINYNLAYGSKLLATTATVSNKNISKRGTPTLGTRSDGFVQTECTASWQGFSLWSNALNLTVGTTYTYSFYGYTNSTNNTNAAISFYPMMYNSAGTRDTTSTLPISVQGGSFTNANAKQIGQLNTTPTLYWATFTWNQTMADIITNNGKIELSIQVHGTLTDGRIDYLWAPKLEIGNKPTGWMPSIEEMGIDVTKIEDSSGYNNNGTVIGTTTITEDSPRYSLAISMNNTSTTNHIESINDITLSDNISVSFWVKASKSTSQVIFSTKNIQFGILNSLGYVLPSSAAGYQLTDFVTNSWNHICVVKNAGTFTLYVNGNKPARSGSNNYYVHNVDKIWLFNRSYNSSYGANASISDFRFYATPLLDNDIKSLYNVGMKIDNLSNLHAFEFDEEDKNVLAGIPWTSSYLVHSTTQNLFTNYNSNGEPQFTANSTSAGSKYIEITPGVYYYDTTISVNAGNQFYIGFERYDADKTSRSNQACVYIYGTKPSSDVVKQRYKGTIDLSTDSVNPLKYITLRVLNGWSGTNSGVTGQATIHHLSLRLVSGAQNPKLEKTGQFITSELKEMGKSSLYQNRLVEAAEFIER